MTGEVESQEPAGRDRFAVQRAVLNAEAYWDVERPRVMAPGVREMGSVGIRGDIDLGADVEAPTGRSVRYVSTEEGWSLEFDT